MISRGYNDFDVFFHAIHELCFIRKRNQDGLRFCHAGHLQILAKLSDKGTLNTRQTTVHNPPDLEVIFCHLLPTY
jgi:hypothetical protein